MQKVGKLRLCQVWKASADNGLHQNNLLVQGELRVVKIEMGDGLWCKL